VTDDSKLRNASKLRDAPKLRGALEPAWSEVREQRLLGRIAEGRRQRAHRRQRRTVAAAGTLLVVGAAAVAVIGLRHTGEGTARYAAPSAPRLTLADGSEATLTPNGNVQIEEQTAGRVRLRQRAGGARYVVQHNPARDFVVLADDVTVRVRGTIFSVGMRADTVEVSVERGRVEVVDRLRTRDLVAGESLSVPAHAAPAVPPEAAQEPPAAAPAVGAAEPPHPPRRTPAHVGASDLLARADAARAGGRPDEAARSLEAFVTAHPRDPRAAAALFTLGRVEAGRGRWQAAAAAFDRCAAIRAGGPLADDALAEGAQAWHAAGVVDRARADARAYLAAHPGGLHRAAMRRLADD
jgi:TolA-binding protein